MVFIAFDALTRPRRINSQNLECVRRLLLFVNHQFVSGTKFEFEKYFFFKTFCFLSTPPTNMIMEF